MSGSRLACALAASALAASALAGCAPAAHQRATATRPPPPSRSAAVPVASTRPCGARSRPGRLSHVIWIWMENHSAPQVVGAGSGAPYTTRLAAECGLATNYHNITHPSLPNYLAATSGGTQGVTSDCSPDECPVRAPSLFGQLQNAGREWASYEESMPIDCYHGYAGLYAPKHNPAVYYLPLRPSCARQDVPMGTVDRGRFSAALSTGRLTAFTFVTPNLCDDTHDCPVADGDAWLHSWVPRIFASPAYRDGSTVLFITWDEGAGDSTSACADDTVAFDCHVALLVASRSTPAGARSRTLFNHYSLLGATEQLLGLPPLGAAANVGAGSLVAAFRL
jgi:hypothetical protein